MIKKYLKHDDETGVALIEFAIIAPVFLLLLLSILEIGFMMIIKTNLQTGLTAGARYQSLNANTNVDNTSTVSAIIRQKASGLIDTSKIKISIRSYSTFAAISGTNPSNLKTVSPGTASTGGPGKVVRYQAQFTYKTIVPLVASVLGSSILFTVAVYGKNP